MYRWKWERNDNVRFSFCIHISDPIFLYELASTSMFTEVKKTPQRRLMFDPLIMEHYSVGLDGVNSSKLKNVLC